MQLKQTMGYVCTSAGTTGASCVATHATACANIGIAGSNAGDDCAADPRCTYNDQGTAGDATDDVCEATAAGTCAVEADNGISACTSAGDCTYIVGDCTYDDGSSDDACEPTIVNLTTAFEWINAIPQATWHATRVQCGVRGCSCRASRPILVLRSA